MIPSLTFPKEVNSPEGSERELGGETLEVPPSVSLLRRNIDIPALLWLETSSVLPA